MTIGLFDRSGSLIRVTTIGPSASFGLSMTVTPHTLTSDCFGSWTMTVTWHTFSLGRFGPLSTITSHTCFSETIATLPGSWDLAHAIRLGIKPFAGDTRCQGDNSVSGQFGGQFGVLQPIMPLDSPVKVRPWELTVYPRSHIRR